MAIWLMQKCISRVHHISNYLRISHPEHGNLSLLLSIQQKSVDQLMKLICTSSLTINFIVHLCLIITNLLIGYNNITLYNSCADSCNPFDHASKLQMRLQQPIFNTPGLLRKVRLKLQVASTRPYKFQNNSLGLVKWSTEEEDCQIWNQASGRAYQVRKTLRSLLNSK